MAGGIYGVLVERNGKLDEEITQLA